MGVYKIMTGCLVAERLLPPKHAAFSSTNFENIFQWEHEAGTHPGMTYTVQYKRYGDENWLDKRECQNITQLFCDLTRETENIAERYHARVRAVFSDSRSSNWVFSERFCPREDTTLGRPEVQYFPNVRSIRFSIQPPYTPLKDEDGSQLTVEDIYSRFGTIDYHLKLFNQRTHQEWQKSENSKEFEIFNLNPDTEYNGTIYFKHFQKTSKPSVFKVRTLPDTTWVLYCVGGIIFATGLLFAMICYAIYKYIKQRTAQPKSLDFRGISAFEPLMLTVEHIISPIHELAKSALFIPDVQPPVPPLPQTGYRQQTEVLAFQPIKQPVSQVDGFPSAYMPQIAQENTPCATKNKPLALTYGVCVESLTCIRSQPDQMLPDACPERFASDKTKPSGERFCEENYKEQRPKLAERELWESSDADVRGSSSSRGQAQQLMLQTGCEDIKLPMPQQSLSQLPKGGNYRGQTAGLLPLPSSMTVDTKSPSEVGPPPSLPLLLTSVCIGDDPPEERSSGQLVLLKSLSQPKTEQQPLDFQMTNGLPAAREPGYLGLNTSELHASGPSQHNDLFFTQLFRDLDLKLQWEHGQDENTLMLAQH
ncbi:interleukin-22 receptor subunit alpha-1 [Carettochelys insculpta]|uniref:interleukin-22 receptor subunit alpha-1 n=1 Tax=Carettochelys insculpta TaxID=44489 RepID=UPI003EBAA60E